MPGSDINYQKQAVWKGRGGVAFCGVYGTLLVWSSRGQNYKGV